jgi:hypothetical protein
VFSSFLTIAFNRRPARGPVTRNNKRGGAGYPVFHRQHAAGTNVSAAKLRPVAGFLRRTMASVRPTRNMSKSN